MYKVEVIAGEISNLTDARYFAARCVDYLWFDLSATKIEAIVEILEWTSGVGVLLSIDDQSMELIDEAVITLSPTAIGGESRIMDQLGHLVGHVNLFTVTRYEDNIMIEWDDKTYSTDPQYALNSGGIIILGGVEDEIGVKNYDQIDELLDGLIK